MHDPAWVQSCMRMHRWMHRYQYVAQMIRIKGNTRLLLRDPRLFFSSRCRYFLFLLFFYKLSLSLQSVSLQRTWIRAAYIPTHDRAGRHLSFPRFYSRKPILNRGSQGRLRNPTRHCEDANQFSSRGSFSRSFHRALAQNTRSAGGPTCVCTERIYTRMQPLSFVRMTVFQPSSLPSSFHFLPDFRFIPRSYGGARDWKELQFFERDWHERERERARKIFSIFYK